MRKSYNVKKSKIISPKYWDALALLEGTIEHLVIPDGCKNWQGDLTRDLKSLKTVIIPRSITSLDGLCFDSCPNLQYVEYKGTVAEFKNISKGYKPFDVDLLLKEITCSDGVVPIEEANDE